MYDRRKRIFKNKENIPLIGGAEIKTKEIPFMSEIALATAFRYGLVHWVTEVCDIRGFDSP